MFLFGVYLNWPNVDGLFGGCVGEALVAEGNNADDDKENANDGLGFHGVGVELMLNGPVNGYGAEDLFILLCAELLRAIYEGVGDFCILG